MSYLAEVSYTFSGPSTFTIPFEFLDQVDIKVSVNGVNTTNFKWPNATQITVNDVIPPSAVVRIYRETPDTEAMVDFVDAANIREQDLDRASRQPFFRLQELLDNFSKEMDWLHNHTIEGGDLPVVTGADVNSFLIAKETSPGVYAWQVNSLTNTKAVLGISDAAASLPEPLPGQNGVLTVQDGDYVIEGIKGTRDFLNLGNLALHDVSEVGTVWGHDVGVLVGNVVEVENVSGDITNVIAGLPGIDGRKLKNIPTTKYSRFDERADIGTDGGAYTVAKTWVSKTIASNIGNEIGCSLSAGSVVVPAGTYDLRVRTKVSIDGFNFVRIRNGSSTVATSQAQFVADSHEQTVELTVRATFTDPDGTPLTVQVASTGTEAGAFALGRNHGVALVDAVAVGPNIYTIFELWRLPQ